MTEIPYRKFAEKYKIPYEELDGFLVQYNKPLLVTMLKNLKEGINELFAELEEELEE